MSEPLRPFRQSAPPRPIAVGASSLVLNSSGPLSPTSALDPVSGSVVGPLEHAVPSCRLEAADSVIPAPNTLPIRSTAIVLLRMARTIIPTSVTLL